MTAIAETKACVECGSVLPLSEFYARTDGGHQSYCIRCGNDATNEWRRLQRQRRDQMTAALDPDRIISMPVSAMVCRADIARKAGVPVHVVDHWIRGKNFPIPITRLGDKRGIPVWDYREVEAYIATRRTNK